MAIDLECCAIGPNPARRSRDDRQQRSPELSWNLKMQRVYISPGKTVCRFCGEQVSTNSVSIHIAKKHRRASKTDLSPTLVRKSERIMANNPKRKRQSEKV